MIKRDEAGFIGQHNADYPDYFDMGDTARSTGLMAMAGVPLDRAIINQLVLPKRAKVVRHPIDPKWSNPKLTSRDQVLCFAAGAYHNPSTRASASMALWNYAQEGKINKDILLPHHKWVLRKASRLTPYDIGWGQIFMWAHVVWATKIKPNDEQNQTIAMCAVAGTEYLEALVRWHPDLKKNLDDYWGGHPWRDQPEIAFHIWEYIQGRISG